MKRSILGVLALALLAPLPASAQQRTSLAKQALEIARTKAAICAKADADGDTYRPFVCTPRCDCLADLLTQADAAGAQASCQETSPGVIDIGFFSAPTCSGGYCVGAGGSSCQVSSCPSGQDCVASCAPIIGCRFTCQVPCSSNASCPNVPGGFAQLSGVSPPDSPNVIECSVVTGPLSGSMTKINSNDALDCIDQIEAIAGPCQ